MPLCIDLFCGLGGWSEGFLSEGWDVVGFDIERHRYPLSPAQREFGLAGDIDPKLRGFPKFAEYPAQLVIQDVLTLDGRQFRNADCIVASPPCQEFSYMAMPWSRAKQIAGALREEVSFPEGYTGSRTVADLTALFDACFRIQREAIEATQNVCPTCAGSSLDGDYTCSGCGGLGWTERRYIPMVVENVKGAQPWVGRAKANFGSFYFWGDVAMVGGQVVAGRPQFGQTVKAARRTRKSAAGSWDLTRENYTADHSWDGGGRKVEGFNFHHFEKTGEPGGSFQSAAVKTTAHANIRDRHSHTRHLTNQRESDALKVPGISFTGYGEPGYKPQGFNVTAAQRYRKENGTKQEGSGPEWFDQGIAKHPSRSDSRKAASAQIAKIPFPLASYIARSFKPATK